MLPIHLLFGLIMGLLLVGARNAKERRMTIAMLAVSMIGWGLIVGIEDGSVRTFFGGCLLAGANLAVGVGVGRLLGIRLNRSPRAAGRR